MEGKLVNVVEGRVVDVMLASEGKRGLEFYLEIGNRDSVKFSFPTKRIFDEIELVSYHILLVGESIKLKESVIKEFPRRDRLCELKILSGDLEGKIYSYVERF
jgi:hypothetical protein